MNYARTTGTSLGTFDERRWQPLLVHLQGVASKAEAFGKVFGAAGWGALVGLWHDFGKYHPEFQTMLRQAAAGFSHGVVDHSSAGAVHLANLLRPVWDVLAFPIAGHHAGLADGVLKLKARLDDAQVRQRYQETLAAAHAEISAIRLSASSLLAWPFVHSTGNDVLTREFFIRMLFSALVDADRLDAQQAQELAATTRCNSDRHVPHATVAELRAAADRSIDALAKEHRLRPLGPFQQQLSAYRQDVLRQSRAAANEKPGIFLMDVATGGGKTLSSLSFALRHAEKHGMRRVIVVIPYTSIIEQSAEVFRSALGPDLEDNVLEHHSAVADTEEEGQSVAAAERRRLATENWHSPLVVTTAVQFFESLFAHRPSKCRKLHNICRSVVVVDEAQTLPPQLLEPTVWAINELARNYGCSIVLSTATQPALEPPFPTIAQDLVRCRIQPAPPPPRVRCEVLTGAPGWPDLAHALAEHQQVLCITHRRDDARDLTLELDRTLGNEDTIHLSATMCAEHRSRFIAEIRRRLASGHTCRVVSTQLVEAGVDLDFPVVFRAMGGVDSLAQAAGRCNREGGLGDRGGLFCVYRAPTSPPPGMPRLAAGVAATMLHSAALDGKQLDVLAPDVSRRYFRAYYQAIGSMDNGIHALRREYCYHQVANAYRFIEDCTAVLVPFWGQAEQLIAQLRTNGLTAGVLRKLQRYTISLYPKTISSLMAGGAAEPLVEGDTDRYALTLSQRGLYSERFGLVLPPAGTFGSETLIV